jgi:hypothetical protein
MRMFACYEGILKAKKGPFVSPDFSVGFQVIFRGLCIATCIFGLGDDDPDDPLTVQEEVSPP